VHQATGVVSVRAGVSLADEFDVVDLLQTLTERCVELVDTDAAGLMLVDQRGNLRLVACTHESARLLELFELQQQEGPCLDCFASGQVIANIDLATAADRWPVSCEPRARSDSAPPTRCRCGCGGR
jgi:hypothetical protein